MKHLKSKELFHKIYGGNNTLNPPFQVGDRLRQIWGMDEIGNLQDGVEEYEFIGMHQHHPDMMLIKSLNDEAAHGVDTINPEVRKMSSKIGYHPPVGDTNQLHYKFADRFKIIT